MELGRLDTRDAHSDDSKCDECAYGTPWLWLFFFETILCSSCHHKKKKQKHKTSKKARLAAPIFNPGPRGGVILLNAGPNTVTTVFLAWNFLFRYSAMGNALFFFLESFMLCPFILVYRNNRVFY